MLLQLKLVEYPKFHSYNYVRTYVCTHYINTSNVIASVDYIHTYMHTYVYVRKYIMYCTCAFGIDYIGLCYYCRLFVVCYILVTMLLVTIQCCPFSCLLLPHQLLSVLKEVTYNIHTVHTYVLSDICYLLHHRCFVCRIHTLSEALEDRILHELYICTSTPCLRMLADVFPTSTLSSNAPIQLGFFPSFFISSV